MINKVIRDGKVAVLISGGFGAGWSTWNVSTIAEALLFDPDVVAWVEAGKPDFLEDHIDLEEKYGDYVCALGADDLYIEWVDVGARFRVSEYDGSESLILESETAWFTA